MVGECLGTCSLIITDLDRFFVPPFPSNALPLALRGSRRFGIGDKVGRCNDLVDSGYRKYKLISTTGRLEYSTTQSTGLHITIPQTHTPLISYNYTYHYTWNHLTSTILYISTDWLTPS